MPNILRHSIIVAGIGFSSSATIGAATVNNRPTKLQIPIDVTLL